MIINKVEISNFKIYRNQTFVFDGAKVILLTGDNGFGKTTVLDAIEWCLSGSMGRVKTGYENRHSRQTERNRRENYEGIIKNKYAKKEEWVAVRLEVRYKGRNLFITRNQKEDTIYARSMVKITDINDELVHDDELEAVLKYLSYSFYQSFVCDSDKTTRFFDKSRQDLREMMSDFIEPNEQAKQVVELLEQEKKYLSEDLKNKLEMYKEKNEQKIKKIKR